MPISDRLRKAKLNINDEFYTLYEDIEKELVSHLDYKENFKDKIVYCPCDDYRYSNFYKFFIQYFDYFGLKKLIVTHYNVNGTKPYKVEVYKNNIIKTQLVDDGDFRSNECIKIVKESDIIVTNPPFSLFREFIHILLKYNKSFIIIGNLNALTNKDIFTLIQNNKIYVGYERCTEFFTNLNDKMTSKIPCIWFTNFCINKLNIPLKLTKSYNDNKTLYHNYSNYDGIDIAKLKDIPKDYGGHMGVPFTYMLVHCPEQFDIIGFGKGSLAKEMGCLKNSRGRRDLVFLDENNREKCPYTRVVIQNKLINKE